jgi:hypothetical protein
VAQTTRTEWKGADMAISVLPPLQPGPVDEGAVPQTVANLVALYDEIEQLCESAISRQEGLARQLYAVRPDAPSACTAPAISDLDFDDFRHKHALAAKVVPGGLLNASRRFMMTAHAPCLVEIEDLEEAIRLLRCRMGVVEQDILNLTPGSALDAATKLKFMASLMLDGGNLDVDYFAYLVEECAFIVANQLPAA